MGRCAGWLGQSWRLQCRSQGRWGLDVIPVAAQITCPQWHGVAVHTLRGWCGVESSVAQPYLAAVSRSVVGTAQRPERRLACVGMTDGLVAAAVA